MAAPHGATRCTRPTCPAPAVVRDDRDRPWCVRDYALIYERVENFCRFAAAALRTLAYAA